MQPIIFLYASLAVSAIILALLVAPKVKNRTTKWLGLFFLAVFLLQAGVVFQQSPAGTVGDILFASLIGMLQTFSLDVDYQGILTTVSGIKDAAWMRAYVQAVLVIAPVIGGAAVLTIIMNVFPSVKYRFHILFSGRLYLFSSLDESSLYIAQSLIEKKRVGKWDCIVFANTAENDSDDSARSLLYRAKNLNAITMCMKKPLEELMIPAYVSVYYDFAKKDEKENIDDALALFRAKKGELENCRGQVSFYIYAQPGIAAEVTEQMVAGLSEEKRKSFYVSVIPYVTNAIYKSMTEHPLHQHLGAPEAEQDLTIAVIGDSVWAAELIRTCYWAGQYPHKKLRIVSFSEDAAAMEDRIHTMIPEWDAKREDHAYCDFSFHPFRQDTTAFRTELGRYSIWYAALDEEKENLAVAESLARRLNGLHLLDGVSGTVFCRIDSDTALAVAGRKQAGSLPFTVTGFGSIKDQYAPSFAEDDQISFGWMTEGSWAEYFNMEERYIDADYRERSSKAAAVHLPAKMYALGLDRTSTADGEYKKALLDTFSHFLADDALQKERATDMAVLEHYRWNAYVRANGFTRVDIADWMDYYQDHDEAGAPVEIDSKDIGRGLHTCLLERTREEHDITPYLLDEDAIEKRDWERIRKKYSEAQAACEAGTLDEFDVTAICLYNMGRRNADKLRAYDASSVGSLVGCYVVYDAVKKILSALTGREVRYSDRLGKCLGISCSTGWLSNLVLEKLRRANQQALACQLDEDVLERIANNAKELERGRRKGEMDLKAMTVGDYAKRLSREIL